MGKYDAFENKMKKTLEVLNKNLGAIRAGRANSAVLNKISIEYYGSQVPVEQVGAISSPDPRTLVITPWDASTLKPIVKAIQTSDIGINPQNDGKVIRLVFPPLTEEHRKTLVKQVSKEGEEAKVAIRNIRRDALDKFKAAKKAGEMTEDDVKRSEKDIQTLTDKYIKEIEAISAKKSKELQEI